MSKQAVPNQAVPKDGRWGIRLLATLLPVTLLLVAIGLPGSGPASAAGEAAVEGSVIVAHAVGATGAEELTFVIDGVAQHTVRVTNTGPVWIPSTPTTAYRYVHPAKVAPGQVRVDFANDGVHQGADMNLRITGVEVDGQVFDTRSGSIESTGTWAGGARCGNGFYTSPVLACTGWFQLQDAPVDGGNQPGPPDQPELPTQPGPADPPTPAEPSGGSGGDPADGSEVVVHARGTTGEERLQLLVDGVIIETWPITTADQAYPVAVADAVGPDDVRVAFVNDAVIAGRDRNVWIDAVEIDGVRYESEHPTVRSKGVWANGAQCREGQFSSEQLACNGWFHYAEIDAGGPPVPNGSEGQAEPAAPIGGGNGSELVVRAMGHTGSEELAIVVDGVEVDRFVAAAAPPSSFWRGDSWQEHVYGHPTDLTASQVRLVFDNNGLNDEGVDRNVRVDHIRIDGTVFETEDPTVITSGSWGRGSLCSTGTFGNDNLSCDGYIQYGSSRQGEREPTPEVPSRPASGAAVTIATLGDSNTASGYWRLPFQQRLLDDGCRFDMVGQEATHWGAVDFTGFDADTDALSGAVIAAFRNPPFSLFGRGRATLATGPDLVIVIGGTNDVRRLDLSDAEDRQALDDIIDAAEAGLRDAARLSPNSSFHVVAIAPIRGQESVVRAYNSALAAMVADLGSEIDVEFIDLGVSGDEITTDGIHFTLAGARRHGEGLAVELAAELRSRSSC